jgi:hypothetical protein
MFAVLKHHTMKINGGAEIKCHEFLISASDGVECIVMNQR